MQKQDLIFFIVAIVVVILLAVVVKPIMNGETIQILPSGSSSSQSYQNIPIPSGAPSTPYSPSILSAIATPTPSSWNGGTPINIQFVDPSTYNINFGSSSDFGFHAPGYDEVTPKDEYVTYATIDGQWAATTQIFSIPFPYWSMEVSIEPIGDVGVGGNELLTLEKIRQWVEGNYEMYEEGDSLYDFDGLTPEEISKLYASASAVEFDNESDDGYMWYRHFIIPCINIQVMNAAKPDGILYDFNSRTEGVLKKDPNEDWEKALIEDGGGASGGAATELNEEFPNRQNIDEYYWQHIFREGAGNYYFVIDPNMLKSYKIEIKVPTKFINNE